VRPSSPAATWRFSIRSCKSCPISSCVGACAGAGFSILCAADLAVTADNARFSLAYAGIGASPDGGSSFFLPRLVGYKKAMELTLLPELFDAQAAKQHGLVNWVVPADQLIAETARLAKRLANGPTTAYGEAKQLMNKSLSASMETQMEEELFAFARCARTQDLAEGVTAFVEKRKPVFKGQ
jgi:2-(1,2-epoxy-1,2-dihydrophenyl)acetyl-CoA isomerase